MENEEYMLQRDFAIFQNYLKEIFEGKFGDDEWPPPHRPITLWYSDIINALTTSLGSQKTASDEQFLFLTLCHYHSVYNGFDHTLSDYREGTRSYQMLRNKKDLLIDCCQSLLYAEKQQQALEINLGVASRSGSLPSSVSRSFASVFWSKPLSETYDFYKSIAEYAVQYYKQTSRYQKHTDSHDLTSIDYWLDRIRKAADAINQYPITTMLFPTLLVSYIVNPHDNPTIYPRMKYQKSKLPRNNHADSVKDGIESLYDYIADTFDELIGDWLQVSSFNTLTEKGEKQERRLKRICQIYKENRRAKCGFVLPVVSLSYIAETLSKMELFQNSTVYGTKQKIEHELKKLIFKNGRSYGEYRKEDQSREEAQVILAIAKLCNSNSYIYYSCGEMLDQGVTQALDYLLKKHVLPVTKATEEGKYHLELYRKFCEKFSIKPIKLSALAFYKYFQPTLSFDILNEIPFFRKLLSQASTAITEINHELRKGFGRPLWWGSKALELSHKLSGQLRKKLTVEESNLLIKEFIQNKCNFSYDGFLKFLKESTKAYKLNILEQIPPELTTQVIALLFDDVLHMASAVLVDLVRRYCNQELKILLNKRNLQGGFPIE